MCISPVEPTQQPGFWGWEHTYFLKPNLSFIGLLYMCLFRFTNPTSTSLSPNLSHVPSVAEVASSLRPWKRHELSVPTTRAWVPWPECSHRRRPQHGERWARGGVMLWPRSLLAAWMQHLPLRSECAGLQTALRTCWLCYNHLPLKPSVYDAERINCASDWFHLNCNHIPFLLHQPELFYGKYH